MSVITEEEFIRIVNDKKRLLYKLAKGILNNDTDAEDALAEAVILSRSIMGLDSALRAGFV